MPERSAILIDEERLSELRQVLGRIPGASELPWVLELYDPVTGRLASAIDIRTGESLPRRYRQRQDLPPGRPRSDDSEPGHTR